MNPLAPLGAAFGAAARLRVELYRRGVLSRERLAGPVVSVGNLAVGGSGKSPVVARVATLLREASRPVAILSRGYRGAYRDAALVVSDGTTVATDASIAGDEPVMLARALPGVVVAVGRRRIDAGRLVEARFGPRVHVLDDGFQHLRLHRDLDIVCLRPSDRRDAPLPAGRLREPLSALSRCDLALLDVTDEDDRAAFAQRLGERLLVFRRRPAGVADPSGAPCATPSRPWLLSGIARPERFHADVARLGLAVVGKTSFPDHHRWSVREIERVAEDAGRSGADAILTTAKDAVRLPERLGSHPVAVLRIVVEIEDERPLRVRLGALPA